MDDDRSGAAAGSRRILITGAGSGIGRATAIRLARGGARVALAGRRGAPLEETAEACGGGLAVPCDVADEAAVGALAEVIGREWGALDGLVNNAGLAHYAAVEATSLADWNQVLAVNLTGPFLVTRALLPLLRAGDRPSIVMVASTLGLVGLSAAPAYCAAKAGLVNFGRALALAEAGRGVRVNIVCPAIIDTPMVAGDKERLARVHPVGRLGEPDEVAQVIEQLLAPGPGFLTGSVIAVDGAQTAGFTE